MRLAVVSSTLGFLLAAPAQSAGPPASALAAFQAHVRYAESRVDSILKDDKGFLWANTEARRERLRRGEVVTEPRVGRGQLTVKGGLIHDWVGAVFIPGASVARVLELIQNYDNHKNAYSNVVRSQTLKRDGNKFTVYLRVLERQPPVTVVLDTEYDVEYRPLGNGDWRSRSYSTNIREVVNPGQPNESRKPPGQDRGYLWALNTYWLFRQGDGGAYVECEAVSLSRGLPAITLPLAPLVRSIVRGLPRRYLQNTLQSTRDLVLGKGPGSRG